MGQHDQTIRVVIRQFHLLHSKSVHGHVSVFFFSAMCEPLLTYIIPSMYGYYYLMFTTFPVLYMETYGFSTGIAGLVNPFI